MDKQDKIIRYRQLNQTCLLYTFPSPRDCS